MQSDRDRMNALKSRLGMVPKMQGGGQPPAMPPMPQQPPPPVPAVGGGLPSIADNMRNSMPPARPMPAPPSQAPMPAPEEGGMAEVDQMLAGLDEDTRAGTVSYTHLTLPTKA